MQLQRQEGSGEWGYARPYNLPGFASHTRAASSYSPFTEGAVAGGVGGAAVASLAEDNSSLEGGLEEPVGRCCGCSRCGGQL